MEEFRTVAELAKEWDISPRTVRTMCQDGRISEAFKVGNTWAIPRNADRPSDGRETSGKYKNWRKIK